MKMNRRDLLKLGAVQAVTFAVTNNVLASSDEVFNLASPKIQTGPSIFQGATDEARTQFSIMIDSHIPCDVFVTNKDGKIWKADKTEVLTNPVHPKKIVKVFFSDLGADEIYYLNVANEETNQALDKREFKMLKAKPSGVRFAVCSCMDDRQHKPAIWQNLVGERPDIIFFVGDFVYADNGPGPANPDKLWKRFCDARATLNIFFSYRLIPILATWDDHDFGLNDSNSESYPYVKESQKNFLSFFGQEEEYCRYLKRGPGVSSALSFNSQLFVLLDDRSYRKPNKSEDRHAHWGREQEEWMLDLIEKNNGPSWVMNGSQFFPKILRKESVAGNHPVQLKGFLHELKNLQSKVIFVSGDVHFSEISKIEKEALGYRTYEITSSSVHSLNFPSSPVFYPNSRRIAGTGHRNYVMVHTQAAGAGANMTVTSYDSKGKDLFELNLSV